MNKKINTRALTFASVGVAINVIFGTIAGMINIPLLFLDTIGTIFTAVVFGPFYVAIVG